MGSEGLGAGSVAVTVTEAGGAVVEMGSRGATPCGRRGGSWDGSMVGRGGKGARPGMLRGGRDARGGTVGDGRKTKRYAHVFFVCLFLH